MNRAISNDDKRYLILLETLLFCSYAYFFQGGRDNGIARLAQTDAIITHGALNIDKYAYRSADVIKYNEVFYPNKAPGLSFLCIPAWFITKHITKKQQRIFAVRCSLRQSTR